MWGFLLPGRRGAAGPVKAQREGWENIDGTSKVTNQAINPVQFPLLFQYTADEDNDVN